MTELGVVRRNIDRADRAAVDALARFGVATVHEAMGRVGLMQPYMRPIYAGAQVSGTAVTVLLHPGDNWMMHVGGRADAARRRRRRRDHRRMHRRLFRRSAGDQLQGARRAGAHHRRGRARREDADRDGLPGVEQMRQRQGHGEGDARLGQHSRSSAPARSSIRATRSSPTTTASSSCRRRGPRRRSPRREAREANEGDKRAKLASGVLGLDMYKMREPLEKAGLKYID